MAEDFFGLGSVVGTERQETGTKDVLSENIFIGLFCILITSLFFLTESLGGGAKNTLSLEIYLFYAYIASSHTKMNVAK